MRRLRISSRLVRTIALLAAGLSHAFPRVSAAERLEITVEPQKGSLDSVFSITLMNLGTDAAQLDSCAMPLITAVSDGQKVFCPPPPDPAACELGILPAGESIQVEWQPRETPCDQRVPEPALYEVHWEGLPGALPARVELFPDTRFQLEVRAEPAEVRFGEPVKITVENTSGKTLHYNSCCFPPTVLDPRGHTTFCTICFLCNIIVDFAPGEVLSFDWIPGESTCDDTGSLPGRHRIVWSDFWEDQPGANNRYIGETFVLVLPPADRRLELSLSLSDVRAGETLEMTAVNPLDVPVWRAGCCDTAIFIDELGWESPCSACPLDCVVERNDEIPPGQGASLEVSIPAPDPCALRPGRWSVIWGPNFGLSPGGDPVPPVYGYAEVRVLASGGDPAFRRGNCDGSAELDLTDAIRLLEFLFLGGSDPSCLDACDADDTGILDVTDAVRVLGYLFLGGTAPEAPFPEAGPDPTTDDLGCANP